MKLKVRFNSHKNGQKNGQKNKFGRLPYFSKKSR
jgi:hypothetical protein